MKIDAAGRLRYQRGAGAWVDFDPQPPGPATHVAADNNRVFVRTADGRLHWTCLATDIASWVDYTFGVVQAFATTSATFNDLLGHVETEFAGQLDLATMLGALHHVGDLWDGGIAPAAPTERRALLDQWLGRYRAWLVRSHTVPAGALHGPWNTLARGVDPAAGAVDRAAVVDIAVGHWHRTVVTFYLALPDGRVLYLDEEPMMPLWRVLPGSEDAAARQKSGLHADPDAVLVASHSVLAILQPASKTVAWRRFDYHNPSDFKLWPLLNWTEPGFTTRALPVAAPEAIALDAGFHGPGGTREPWPVPQPHPFLRVMQRRDEEALLQHLRDYQDTVPPFDWLALFGIGLRILEIFGRVPAGPAEPAGDLPFDPWSIPEKLGRYVKHSEAVRLLVDGFQGIEAALFNHLDDRPLFPQGDALRRRAQALRATGTGFLITAWEVIRDASARIDALTGRLSVVGAFGDDPLPAPDAWPIDLWIRDRGGEHAHLCAAEARHAPTRLDVQPRGAGRVAPPSTGRLRWQWIGEATRSAAGELVRRVRVELDDGLGSGRRYRWTLGDGGITGTTQPALGLTVRLDAGDVVVRVEGQDASGERVHASATLAPATAALLALDLPGSTPLGPPTARHFTSPDGRLASAMTLTQQAYATLRVRVQAAELVAGPCTLAWHATHHRAGSAATPGLPMTIDVPMTAGAPPRLADPANPANPASPADPPVLTVPSTLHLAEPVPCVLTVTVRDGVGQQATAHLALSPWFPVRQEVHGAPAAPGLARLHLDERLETLRDELRARARPDLPAIDALTPLMAARARSTATPPAVPVADPTVDALLAAGWVEGPPR
ncbi:MAG: PKD domain-containing protein [bacterium]